MLTQDTVKIGTGPDCDVVVKGAGIEAEHAVLEWRQKQGNALFCKALVSQLFRR